MSSFIQWASNSEYFLSWAVYLLGMLGVLVVAWRISRVWPSWLKVPLRVLLTAILLAPLSVGNQAVFQAPAWIVGPFEWLVHGKEAGMQAVNELLLYAGCALLALALLVAVKHLYKRLGPVREESV